MTPAGRTAPDGLAVRSAPPRPDRPPGFAGVVGGCDGDADGFSPAEVPGAPEDAPADGGSSELVAMTSVAATAASTATPPTQASTRRRLDALLAVMAELPPRAAEGSSAVAGSVTACSSAAA